MNAANGKKRADGRRIVYSINVDDIQEVSRDVLERNLTKDEVFLVENAIGNYIDWFQAIENAIRARVGR